MHFFDSKKREMFAQAMHILPQLLQTRVDQESWYEVKFKKERWAQTTGWTIIFAAVALSFFLLPAQLSALIASFAVAYGIIRLIAPSEARLSQEGRELREEWLGFKLYMETAERYRLQNLTPDLFEKFLPYTMIFGIEKKWAKAFEGMQIAPPLWYHGAALAGTMNGGE